MINTISFPNLGISFDISRVAFSIFGIDVFWYGILIALGLGLAFVYAWFEAPKAGLKRDDLLNMLIIALPVAVICARLYYVIFSFDIYRGDWLSVFDIRSGGIAIYGAVIGAALAVVIYCRVKKISIGITLDILAIGLLIGQAVGRWGNFVNGEAFGSVTSLPWAMSIENASGQVAAMVHPTFLYESLWNAAGIGVLLFYKKIKIWNGELFCAYAVWYGLGRVWIEGLRTDSLYFGPLRVSQIVALLSIIIGLAIIIIVRLKKERAE